MTIDTLTDVDRDALQRALDMTLAEPDRAEQLQHKLQNNGWHEAAKFAAYHQQVKNLRLQPWQSPPCSAGTRTYVDEEILEISRRLVRLGLSLFEPDPLDAIDAKQVPR
jgi:hypothetical protein